MRNRHHVLVVLFGPVLQRFQSCELPGILLHVLRLRAHQWARVVLEALGRRAHLREDLPADTPHGLKPDGFSGDVCPNGLR